MNSNLDVDGIKRSSDDGEDNEWYPSDGL